MKFFEIIQIDERFNGPPHSGNGGYVSGLLAQYFEGPVKVVLRKPPPLNKELRVGSENDKLILSDNESIIAEAETVDFELEIPPAPSLSMSREMAVNYAGFHEHVFPTCFVCGPDREPGDGLRIFPGTGKKEECVASPFYTFKGLYSEDHMEAKYIWAALDCPGAYAISADVGWKKMVLGTLYGRLVSRIDIQEKLIVYAWSLGVEGRKNYAGSAVANDQGEVKAYAKATWIEIE